VGVGYLTLTNKVTNCLRIRLSVSIFKDRMG